MKRTRHLSDAPGNKLAACVCLAAVLLLWAPLWVSAFQAKSMACCDGAMCPLHGHAPKKSSNDGQAGKEAQPATCEHHGGKSAMSCSMACCHPETPVVTGATVFLLPPALLQSRLSFVVAPLTISGEREIHPSITPPDHPPR